MKLEQIVALFVLEIRTLLLEARLNLMLQKEALKGINKILRYLDSFGSLPTALSSHL